MQNLTFPIDHTKSKSTVFFLRRLPVLVASPKVQSLVHYFFCYNNLAVTLGDSAFIFADDVKIVFFIFSLFAAWTWAGGLSCLTVGNLPPLSPSFFVRQMPIIKSVPSPTSETWGFPLTRFSPRQCTAERLRIQQGNCCSWSSDRSLGYLYQPLPHRTAKK